MPFISLREPGMEENQPRLLSTQGLAAMWFKGFRVLNPKPSTHTHDAMHVPDLAGSLTRDQASGDAFLYDSQRKGDLGTGGTWQALRQPQQLHKDRR